jgi:hypothetical protein
LTLNSWIRHIVIVIVIIEAISDGDGLRLQHLLRAELV